jgi:hypothetical protein
MDRLGIRSGDTVYELGCGAGAFLYPLWQRGVKVGGLDYSSSLLDAARRGVAILDLPDLATRDAAEAARRTVIGEEEYRRLYEGLGHQYYDRADLAARMARPGWRVKTEGQWLDGYFHAPYRFNAWAVREANV